MGLQERRLLRSLWTLCYQMSGCNPWGSWTVEDYDGYADIVKDGKDLFYGETYITGRSVP
jgi:hypothetical protein